MHLIKTVMQLFSGGVGGLSVTTPLPIVNLDVVVGGESGGITSDVCPATCGDCLSDAVDSCLSCRTGYKRIGSAPFPTACVGTYDPTKGLRMKMCNCNQSVRYVATSHLCHPALPCHQMPCTSCSLSTVSTPP